ncbi:aldo/keto reductase [Rhizobium sp. G187]|uniref:aldo/keto reductase n=1 Tax=Rhizobium sp. G187 TaxID=3451352 RepID=UPI003EE43EA5
MAALAWVVQRPGVSSVLIGASKPDQLAQNPVSLDLVLSSDQRESVEQASALPVLNPDFIFHMPSKVLFRGRKVKSWPRA